MTMLYSSQGTIRFPIAVGQTLIVQNISGVETVSGSSASREDASARFGSGYFVYGPQSSAGTIQLSTTGQLDYQLVVGDATPWNNFIPLSGSSSGVSAGGDLAAGSAAVAAALGASQASGASLSRLPYLQKANWCYMDTSNPAFAGNFTQHIQMTVEAPFVAVQIGVVNGYTSGGSQTVKVAVSTMAAAGDPATTAPLNNGGTWVNAGNGGASLVVPAATTQNTAPGIAWGDIVALASLARSDGGTFPLLCVRVQNPSGNNLTGIVGATNAATPFEVENYNGAPYGRLYRARSQVVLGVDTIGAMTTTSADQSYGAPIIVRYFLANGTGRTLTVFGDSIDCGYGQSTLNSWTWIRQAAHMKSSQSDPVEICCLANSGYTMTQISQRASALASHCKGTTAIIPLNSPNSVGSGTLTQATLNSTAAQFIGIYKALSDQGIPTIVRTFFATTTAAKSWAAGDVLRVTQNTTRAQGSKPGSLVLDVAALATSGPDGTGQYQLSPAESDGIHPAASLASTGASLLTAVL